MRHEGTEARRHEGEDKTDAPVHVSLVEASEGFARAVDDSGVSDHEFASILSEARDAVRRDRHHKPA